MGLATIDPHSHKVHTKFYKIPKFGVNRPKSKLYGHSDAVSDSVRMPYISLLIAVSQSKLAWLTPNLGIFWISVCSFWLCGPIVANPIFYRLIPSPSRCEIRQFNSLWCLPYCHRIHDCGIFAKEKSPHWRLACG